MEVFIAVAVLAAIAWFVYKNYNDNETAAVPDETFVPSQGQSPETPSWTKPSAVTQSRHGSVPDYRAWKRFGERLKVAESDLADLTYPSLFTTEALHKTEEFLPGLHLWGVPPESLALEQIEVILSEAALAPPHGLDLLDVFLEPRFPSLPEIPDTSVVTDHEQRFVVRYNKLREAMERKREMFAEIAIEEENKKNDLVTQCEKGEVEAVRTLMLAALTRHPLPKLLRADTNFAFDSDARVALCIIEVPDLSKLGLVNKRANSSNGKWLNVSEAERKRSSERILHSLCIRAAYLIAMSDPAHLFDTVAVNAHQHWFDPATGAPREGVIASLQGLKSELQKLQPGRLDAKACFRHLAGISTPNVIDASPIRPIFAMNTDDERIVPNKDVASDLEAESNLATMPWEDFEHLVRQLFEWMFTNEGVEVKVTRASRDRGVDAIMFDPDPVRGGKYILQAKRYTRTVDVAAVRDLYGTIVNEGANRGILVTTATFGPDAYEFAKNKPISLIDGPNLITLLRKHGRLYRIDLDEARRAEAEHRASGGS